MSVASTPLLGAVAATAAAIPAGLYFSSTTAIKAELGGIDIEEEMPDWRPLSSDTSASTTYASDKYAASYLKYLVAVGTAETSSEKAGINLDEWWNWSYRKNFETNKAKAKGKFKTVNHATTGNQSLKKICESSYSEKTGSNEKILTTWDDSNEEQNKDKFLEENIWLFCSIGGTKIKTISESNDSYTGTNFFGNTEADKKALVSTKDAGSDWFWALKEEELFKPNTNPETVESEFKKLYNSDRTSWSTTTRKVKAKCEAAYQTSKDGTTGTYPKAEVYKYCSLKGQAAG